MNPAWRMFFALMPGPRTRGRLRGLAVGLAAGQAARIVPATNLHLTLLFLGQLAPERIASVALAGQRAAATSAPMTLAIERIGWFGQAGVVWGGPARAPMALLALHEALARECLAAGLSVDRRALVPHLTLLRKVRRAPAPALAAIDPPIVMPVRRLALLRSVSEPGGVRYRPLASWPLGAAGARPRIAAKRSA